MDIGNMKALNNKCPENAKPQLLLLASFDPNGAKVILDPSYLEEIDYEKCYQQCLSCCTAFITQTSSLNKE
ncbi:hypothetical protein LSTR_LSTR008544 [Laodelphax striatellus]|uniref:Low molecular weight phosphotyrosine protein phosphatase n=1 Tax=Laodelphax striatellus TaxID=195883 RepID=A0A482WRY8_LAOST|nr:hypothetical protein LSTR_LSTR008544 [Laodelphax striatellus]